MTVKMKEWVCRGVANGHHETLGRGAVTKQSHGIVTANGHGTVMGRYRDRYRDGEGTVIGRSQGGQEALTAGHRRT